MRSEEGAAQEGQAGEQVAIWLRRLLRPAEAGEAERKEESVIEAVPAPPFAFFQPAPEVIGVSGEQSATLEEVEEQEAGQQEGKVSFALSLIPDPAQRAPGRRSPLLKARQELPAHPVSPAARAR